MTGQGEMQRQRATWMMKRVSGHGPGSWATRWEAGGSYCCNPTAGAVLTPHSQIHAQEPLTQAERQAACLQRPQRNQAAVPLHPPYRPLFLVHTQLNAHDFSVSLEITPPPLPWGWMGTCP